MCKSMNFINICSHINLTLYILLMFGLTINNVEQWSCLWSLTTMSTRFIGTRHLQWTSTTFYNHFNPWMGFNAIPNEPKHELEMDDNKVIPCYMCKSSTREQNMGLEVGRWRCSRFERNPTHNFSSTWFGAKISRYPKWIHRVFD